MQKKRTARESKTEEAIMLAVLHHHLYNPPLPKYKVLQKQKAWFVVSYDTRVDGTNICIVVLNLSPVNNQAVFLTGS